MERRVVNPGVTAVHSRSLLPQGNAVSGSIEDSFAHLL